MTTRTAMICRSDQGGLASQTWEMARNVRPYRILIIDMAGHGRGDFYRHRYDGLAVESRTVEAMPSDDDCRWLVQGMRAVYTAETPYNLALPRIAAEHDCRLVIHANVELWNEEYRGPSTNVVLPTVWEATRVATSTCMPMPVARDRLPFRLRTEARTFLYQAAPAMEDRNGAQIVAAALPYVTTDARLLLAGLAPRAHRRTWPTATRVKQVLLPPRDDYWTLYADADVLILPRRYGGLSLTAQEALASGMPVIMLDLPPYSGKGGIVTIPTRGNRSVPMKGGMFDVHDADPRALAGAMDLLAGDPTLVKELSQAADEHAERLDWRHWAEPWQRFLS